MHLLSDDDRLRTQLPAGLPAVLYAAVDTVETVEPSGEEDA